MVVTTGLGDGKMFCWGKGNTQHATMLDVGYWWLDASVPVTGRVFPHGHEVCALPKLTGKSSTQTTPRQKNKKPTMLPMLAELFWLNYGSFSLLLVAAVAFVLFRR